MRKQAKIEPFRFLVYRSYQIMNNSNSSISADNSISPKSPLFLFGLLVFIGFSRYLPLDHSDFFNFSPTLAIFLIAGSYLRGIWSWTAPLCAVFVSDLFLNAAYGMNWLEPYMLITCLSYLVIFGLGKWMGPTRKLTFLAGGAIGSALLFHIITCSFSWIANPAYIKSVEGLLQAWTLGEPGFAPAYMFLKNSLLSTLFFSFALRWAISLKPEQIPHSQTRSAS